MSNKSKLKIELEEDGQCMVDVQGDTITLLSMFCSLFEKAPSVKAMFQDAIKSHDHCLEKIAEQKRKAAEN